MAPSSCDPRYKVVSHQRFCPMPCTLSLHSVLCPVPTAPEGGGAASRGLPQGPQAPCSLAAGMPSGTHHSCRASSLA